MDICEILSIAIYVISQETLSTIVSVVENHFYRKRLPNCKAIYVITFLKTHNRWRYRYLNVVLVLFSVILFFSLNACYRRSLGGGFFRNIYFNGLVAYLQ